MKVSDSGLSAYNIAVTKAQRPRSEWHVGRHGRKAWLKDVAEWRGFGVAGKRGRKAWLKGVVLRHACRIEDVVLISVGLPEQGTDNSRRHRQRNEEANVSVLKSMRQDARLIKRHEETRYWAWLGS